MADIITEDMQQNEILDTAVAEGGIYEILRRRLADLGAELSAKTSSLNDARLKEFGRSTMDIAGRIRIRTENNCIARDIKRVGDYLLFGYNVFMGLKRETRVEDVFSLYKLIEREDEFDAEPVPLKDTFLDIPAFVQEFEELYKYYKNTRLLQLAAKDGKLLASFQIGEKIDDIRVFRWSISPDGHDIRYIDNRGERDIILPPAQDFEWFRAGREHEVNGRHPHLNILDTIFVETVGGDLTIKRENNTHDGLGIYSEEVLDKNQSLGDAVVEYARLGHLILLKILPYREHNCRYFVYNVLTHDVRRIDAIGQACVQLPEDHGIIFPGGYYLQNGEHKTFDREASGFKFRKMRRSPNGEDVLYIFYDPAKGKLAFLNYNMIERSVQSPLHGNGFALYEDGRMVLFEDEAGQATRVHAMQIWQTPYASAEFAARAKNANTPLGRIGNAELVRGVSDLFNIVREIEAQRVSAALYDKLSRDTRRLFDIYFWLKDENTFGCANLLREIAKTGELVLDEYEKVENIRNQSAQALQEALMRQRELFEMLLPESWHDIQEFADGLNRINVQRGRVISLKNQRYMNLDEVDRLEAQLVEREALISRATAEFLAGAKALTPFIESIEELNKTIAQAENSAGLAGARETLTSMSANLDMLAKLISGLSFDDVTLQTAIIENISEVFAKANQIRARLEQRRQFMDGEEAVARFGAQFKLFGQSIAGAVTMADDPEKCDEELARLLVQLEELESQFAGYDQFQADILQKREELLETFEAHKQNLLDERQRRAQALLISAERILATFPRRTARLTSIDEINAFFVADPMARKAMSIAKQLRALKDTVKADDIEARFKATQDQALRAMRDKTELYEDGGATIRLGPRHRFSVNTQELDLTILPRGETMYLQLTGTDYHEPLHNADLEALREYWHVFLESETKDVSRAEYLAYSFVYSASKKQDDLSMELMNRLLTQPAELEKTMRAFAAARYKDGYEKGIHDHDAVKILQAIVPVGEQAGFLRYDPVSRALAMLFWQSYQNNDYCSLWPEWAKTSAGIVRVFGNTDGLDSLRNEMAKYIGDFVGANNLGIPVPQIRRAAEFLNQTLARTPLEFICSKYGRILAQTLKQRLEDNHLWTDFATTQRKLAKHYSQRWQLALNWLKGLTSEEEFALWTPYAPEAAALLMLGNAPGINLTYSEADLFVTVTGLLSEHPRIMNGEMTLRLGDYFGRMRHQRKQVAPGFRHYLTVRQKILDTERENMRLAEFKPQPLTSFVRNQLIDKVYLPLIGDNLAKQIGATGAAKRTDLMGLLMLISPPGYGKTTLMEYVAACLGLIFMKISGPALGHGVISLDPAQAPDATSRQELQKLNLALEMGNNVMLYVDDIQHTHPEFLQKFISLCDATRRIEGVWKGRTKTYDLRGKKFCVVMAGNPYTESGEIFKVPDMLANRADVYNLGEVLGGMKDALALSYLENSLTSNPVLLPLAQRDMRDVYYFIDRAMGKPANANDLSANYSEAESGEIAAVFERLLKIREIVMQVNRNYIDSAAQSAKYRTEPAFKLQGSYRSMNKLAGQVSAVMNDAELERIIDDFYIGEAQLLTEAAEENLLKLAEIRGRLTDEQLERWEEIKRQFLRNKAFGGDQSEVGDRVVAQLIDLAEGVHALGKDKPKQPKTDPVARQLETLTQTITAFGSAKSSAAQDPVTQQLAKLNTTLETFGAYQNAVMDNLISERKAEIGAQKTPADDRIVVLFARLVKSVQEISTQKQGQVNEGLAAQIAELVQSIQMLGQTRPGAKTTAKAGSAPVAAQLIAENTASDIGEQIVVQLKSLVHSVHTLRMVAEAAQGGKKLRG